MEHAGRSGGMLVHLVQLNEETYYMELVRMGGKGGSGEQGTKNSGEL